MKKGEELFPKRGKVSQNVELRMKEAGLSPRHSRVGERADVKDEGRMKEEKFGRP